MAPKHLLPGKLGSGTAPLGNTVVLALARLLQRRVSGRLKLH